LVLSLVDFLAKSHESTDNFAGLNGAHDQKRAAEYVQELHEIRTGHRIESVFLSKLGETWDTARHRRDVSPRYVAQVQSVFARLITFMGRKFPSAETLADVTPARTTHSCALFL